VTSSLRYVQARRCIQAGGLIAYPTEAVYGLGCDPCNPGAVDRLLALKQRPVSKGLILLAADRAQLTPFLAPLDDALEELLSQTWPGPVTWVLPAARTTPPWLTGRHATLAVRVTGHGPAAELCRVCGPLVSTSANRSGHPPARTALAARLRLGSGVDLVVVGATGGNPRPTEIRDGLSGRVLRAS